MSAEAVREALRLLAAPLTRTCKGAGGGSDVTVPSPGVVSSVLHSSLLLTADAQDVNLEQLLEPRALHEAPAAALAATRVDECGRGGSASGSRRAALVRFLPNQNFHSVVIAGAGNALLALAVRPIFRVLQLKRSRSRFGARFHRALNEWQRATAAAVEAGDRDAAAAATRSGSLGCGPRTRRPGATHGERAGVRHPGERTARWRAARPRPLPPRREGGRRGRFRVALGG